MIDFKIFSTESEKLITDKDVVDFYSTDVKSIGSFGDNYEAKLEYLENIYKNEITHIFDPKSQEELLELYKVIKSFGFDISIPELDKEVKNIHNFFVRYIVNEGLVFEKSRIEDVYLEEHIQEDQLYFENTIISLIKDGDFQEAKNLILIGESLQLGDKFRIDLLSTLNETIKNRINSLKGEILKINGEKRDIQNEIILAEGYIKNFEQIIGAVNNSSIKDKKHILRELEGVTGVDNKQLQAVKKYVKQQEKRFFTLSIFLLKAKEFKKSFNTNLGSKILDILDSYKNIVGISKLTRAYNNKIQNEEEINNQIRNLNITLSLKDDNLIKNIDILKKEINDFITNGDRYTDEEQYEKTHKILGLLNKIPSFKDSQYYLLYNEFFSRFKNKLDIIRLKEELEKEKYLLDIGRKIDQSRLVNDENSEYMNGEKIFGYFKSEFWYQFFINLYKGDYETARELAESSGDTNTLISIIESIQELDALEKSDSYSYFINNYDVDLTILDNFGKLIRKVFEDKKSRIIFSVINNILDEIIGSYEGHKLDTNEEKIVEELNQIKKELDIKTLHIPKIENEINDVIAQHMGDYAFQEIDVLNYRYYNALKEWSIEFSYEYMNMNHYNRVFKEYLEDKDTILKLVQLGISQVYVSNHFSAQNIQRKGNEYIECLGIDGKSGELGELEEVLSLVSTLRDINEKHNVFISVDINYSKFLEEKRKVIDLIDILCSEIVQLRLQQKSIEKVEIINHYSDRGTSLTISRNLIEDYDRQEIEVKDYGKGMKRCVNYKKTHDINKLLNEIFKGVI